jgi:hypothetical protein
MEGFDALREGLGAGVAFVSSGAGHGVGVWILAIVLLWSSIPKLKNPLRAAIAIADFGVVSAPRAWHGLALGALEMGLALFLLSGLAPTVALGFASLLFLAFVFVIARSLAAGKEFPCYCFGGEGDGLGVVSALRAAALAVLAVMLLAGSDSAVGPLAGDSGLQLVSAAALVGTLVLLSQYRRLIGWNRDTVEYLRGLEEVA